jgi:hypothetical protein
MKKDINKTLFAMHLAAVGVCLLFISCFSPYDGGEGSLTITLPGHSASANASIARSAVPSAGTQSRLAYEVIFTSGGQTKTIQIAPPQVSFSISLTPGTWDITAEAYLPGPPAVQVGTGEAQITIVAGETRHADIKMIFDNTTLESVTVTYNGADYDAVLRGPRIRRLFPMPPYRPLT